MGQLDETTWVHSLKLTYSPRKQAGPQKGNNRIPTTHFQVRAVSFREGISVQAMELCLKQKLF